jgi:hypothetical protein
MNRNSAFRFASMIAPLLLLAMAGCAHHESAGAAAADADNGSRP